MGKKTWWLEQHLLSILLFASLAIAAPLIVFILVPKGTGIAPDFGVNLATEIISIILTVFILTQILQWNQSRPWRRVKTHVYLRIGEEVHYIIEDLICYVSLPRKLPGLDTRNDNSADEESKRFLEKVRLVCESDSIIMNSFFRKLIQDGKFEQILVEQNESLSDIESKYFRFLTPEILVPLMNIQKELSSFNRRIRERQNRKFPNQTEEQFCAVISRIVLAVFKETCELEEEGINISLVF